MEVRDDALLSLWSKATGTPKNTNAASWQEEKIAVASFGVGMEEALNYLYAYRPDFDGFKNWIETAGILPGKQQPFEETVLSAADHTAWADNGYIVIKDAVPKDDCEAARAAIWSYLEADIEHPETWYKSDEDKRGLMLRLFQHEALTRIRYSAKIRKTFEELYVSKELYLEIDKVSFNPPETEKYRFVGSQLHWDVSLKTPIPFELQGFVYLTDTGDADGAFHCVPGFHNNVESWLAGLPAGANARETALKILTPVPVAGKIGDLVIWHQALPHCATPNKGKTPRMVQYVAYKPLKSEAASEWI